MAKRTADHLRAQKAGKERDGYVCQICGSTDRVQGHHMIDHMFGGAPTARNIITLCYRCHQEVHKGNIELTFF